MEQVHGTTFPFERVDLDSPFRRCMYCVNLGRDGATRERHDRQHHVFGSLSWPAHWRVVAETPGVRIPIGTTLRLIDSHHQIFREATDSEIVDWLFEAVDGQIFTVMTTVECLLRPGEPFERPLYPRGLEPIIADRQRTSGWRRVSP